MMPYMSMLFSAFVLASCGNITRLSPGIQRVIWGVIIIFLGLFAGLRGDNVGADTIAYVNRFLYLVSIDQNWDTYGSSEPGYKAILALSRIISNDPTALLIVTSVIASALYITALNRSKKSSPLAIYSFIAFGFFVFHMNGLRQGLAIGIFMHAIPFIVSGRPVAYAALVLLAATFHITAIFALPLYYLFRMGFSLRYLLFSVMAAISIMEFENFIFQIGSSANDRFLTYSLRNEQGGSNLALAYSAFLVGLTLSRKVIPRDARKIYDIYLSIYLLGCVIFVGVVIGGLYVEITRMALYFLVTLPILISFLIQSLPDARMRALVTLVFFAAGCLFFYYYLLSIGNYLPYQVRALGT